MTKHRALCRRAYDYLLYPSKYTHDDVAALLSDLRLAGSDENRADLIAHNKRQAISELFREDAA